MVTESETRAPGTVTAVHPSAALKGGDGDNRSPRGDVVARVVDFTEQSATSTPAMPGAAGSPSRCHCHRHRGIGPRDSAYQYRP